VAVEHRSLEDRNQGQPALRRVPVMLAQGWGSGMIGEVLCAPAAGVGGGLFTKMARRLRPRGAAGTPASPPVAGFAGALLDKTLDRTVDRFKDSLDKSIHFDHAAPPAPAPAPMRSAPSSPVDDLIHLLTHQMADGSFDASGAVDQAVRAARLDRGALLEALEHLLHDAHVPSAAREKIRQTLVVLLLLSIVYAQRKGTWSRAFKKGLRFVMAQAQVQAGVAQGWVDTLSEKFR
jgi:hypothetical protein